MAPVDFIISSTKQIDIVNRREVTLERFDFGKKVEPWGIAPAPDGSLYVGLTTNQIARIAGGKISKFQRTVGNAPFFLLAVEGGDIWFADLGGHRVGRMSPGGIFDELFDLRKMAPAELCLGPDGKIWTVISNRSQLVRLTASGERSDLSHPNARAIATGLGGRIITVDDGYIWEIDEEDEWRRSKFPEGFSPAALVRTPDDSLWFTDFKRNLLCNVIHLREGIEYRFSEDIAPFRVAADADGSLWFPGREGGSFFNLRPDGTATEYAVKGADAALMDVAIAADGSLWFTEPYRYRVARFAR
ncbi:MAG TPA: hypothetical protein VGB54_09970 [Allosphingosinicella sp.]